ncbi:hypothetical protein [Cryptosporangium sp. NPDC051539]|uniref:hypothetical protein n=1 Tax=Cryptosporangium sp. NPDC051539 TaxID=3363962 RepID=UPI00378C4E7E
MPKTSQARSSVTGRFVKKSTADRHPKKTVVEDGAKKSAAKKNRSAVSGEFVKDATVKRHPKTTVTEGKKKTTKKK